MLLETQNNVLNTQKHANKGTAGVFTESGGTESVEV
jgi:hypothetical protein